MSGEHKDSKVINKINRKLKFFYWKNKPELRRMLCNALTQPHFEYACPAWYSYLTKKQISYANKLCKINKCIPFCLRLDKMHHIQGRSNSTSSVAFEVLIINCQTYFIIFYSFNHLSSNFCFPKKSILRRQKRTAVIDACP